MTMTHRDTLGEVLARESSAASPEERLQFAQIAHDAARDGSLRHDEASALATRALAGVSAPPSGELDALAFELGCSALLLCDSFAALDAALDAAIDAGGESVSAGFIFGARLGRAHSRLRQGRIVEAIDDLDDGDLLACHQRPDQVQRTAALRALCVIEREGPEAAEATLARAPNGEDWHPRSPVWLVARARAAAAVGDFERAGRDLVLAGERQLRLGAPNPAHLWWRSDASEVALRLGRREQALGLAFEELELARQFGSPRALGIALRSCGAVCGGARGRELLVESVAVLRDSGAQLELARSLIELGALVRRGGERRDARDVLSEGCDLAERLGATRLSARGRQELAAAGARPRRDRLSGAAALTPSERRTAELAAAGMSNREIASTLFVTMRTVTTHLTHAYQKLGATGRGQLARLLAPGAGERSPTAEVAVSRSPNGRTASEPDRRAGALDPPVARPGPPVARPGPPVAPPGPPASEPRPDAEAAARLAQLTPAARALARSVAVLGQAHAERLAGSLARLEQSAVEPARRELAQAGILGDRGLWFAAAALEAAVYGVIPAHERSHAHRDAARLLAVQRAGIDEIAHHLLRAEPAGDDEAIALLLAAARHALAAGAPARAVSYLRRAVAEPPADDGLGAIMSELGTAEAMVGDPGAAADLGLSLSLTHGGDSRADVAAKLAGALYRAGRFEDSHAVASRAIAELGSDADPELAARLESTRVSVELIDGRLAGRLAERMPYVRALGVAAETGGKALVILEGFWRWQHRLAGQSPRVLVERGMPADSVPDLGSSNGPAVAFAVAIFVLADETERAEQLLERILVRARRRGYVGAEVVALAWRSHLALRTGFTAAAERDARRAAELAHGRDLGPVAAVARCFHAEALAERGRLADAVQTIEAVSLRGLDDTVIAAYTLFVRGRLRVLAGRAAEGVGDLRACGTSSTGLFTDNPEACPWRSTLALALAGGDREEALELARDELALARRRRHTRAVAAALRACGLLEGGEAGILLLREAVGALASSASRLDHARALTDLGVALSRAGQSAEASDSLRAGLAVALRAGATALANRAVRELVATGAAGKRS